MTPTHITTANAIGQVYALTISMSELARTIERLHPDSPARAAALAQYKQQKAEAKALRDGITDIEDRKLATWSIRTANRPVDATGKAIA